MLVNGFKLVNEEKVNRAIYGIQTRGGEMKGGVGEAPTFEEGEEDEAALEAWGTKLVAEYDRLGGLITYNDDRVKMGCFYDFKRRQAVAKPVVKVVFLINGENVEVNADEPLPLIVRAAKKAEQGEVIDDSTEEEDVPKNKSTTLIGMGKKEKKGKKADSTEEEAAE